MELIVVFLIFGFILLLYTVFVWAVSATAENIWMHKERDELIKKANRNVHEE